MSPIFSAKIPATDKVDSIKTISIFNSSQAPFDQLIAWNIEYLGLLAFFKITMLSMNFSFLITVMLIQTVKVAVIPIGEVIMTIQ